MNISDAERREWAQQIEDHLRAAGKPERAEKEKQYLKSSLDFLGASVPQIRKTARALVRRQRLGIDAQRALARELWRRPIHECRSAAVEVLGFDLSRLEPSDLAGIEEWIRQAKTWALVDPLAINLAGDVLERHPDELSILDRWSTDGDFWIRRSALLALLRPLRRGEGDFERFVRYADSMLEEKEFFIRKAIGWVLREVSKTRPELVDDYVAKRVDRVSGVTIREAVKYLPADRRDGLLLAYRARRR